MVAAGAGAALAVIVPLVLVLTVLRALDVLEGNGPLAAFYLALLAALGVGGHRAARVRPDRGLTHGMLAALAAMAAVVILAIVRAAVTDSNLAWGGLLTHFGLAALAGMVGALVAMRRAETQ